MADTPSLRPVSAEDILGTWELVSMRRRRDTGEVVDLFGPAPTGRIAYGSDGSVIVFFVAAGRPRPDSVVAIDDAMRAALYRSMCAYAGRWRLEGTRIRHSIDIAWNEAWSGTDEMRNAGMDEAGRLLLWTDPNRSAFDGSSGVTTVIWRRPVATEA